jgi:rfaE bifunctional protein nucleotidyltransferase chain/domain
MILRTEEDLINWREGLGPWFNKTVVTNGVFDILHVGHVRFIKQAAQLGDFLLIGINSDESVKQLKGPSRPINSALDRAEILCSLKWVDGVFIFNDVRCNRFLELSRPNIYVKAGDYSIESINKEEKKALEKARSEILFLDFVNGFSTTKIIEKISK